MALNDSSELLLHIRSLGSIPSNSPDWTAARMLHQATEELYATHLPMLIAARGEYLVKTVDLPMVAGQSAYRLPARCCSVRYVGYLQSDGSLSEIPESNPSELATDRVNVLKVGRPGRFTFREHFVEVWPIPGSAGDSLRVRYHQRPSRICATIEAAAITVIATDTPTAGKTRITFATPSGSIWSAATRFDFVKSTSPFDIMTFDALPTGSAATTRDFTSTDLSSDIVVGDYITPANYSPFANCLLELHEAIALRTAASIIRPKGDGLAASLEEQAAKKERTLLAGVLAPRSKGNPKTIRTRRWG